MTAPDAPDALLAADGLADGEGKRRRRSDLQLLIERERKFERRVARAAGSAWLVTLTTLPAGVMTLLRDNNPAGVLLTTMGSLALAAALLTTTAWLFRSRAPALAAIEARLARLEELLEQRARPAGVVRS